MDTDSVATFAATGLALYAGHHVGDYWIQTDHQARHKGDAGTDGALQCLLHVLSYIATQGALLAMLTLVTGWTAGSPALLLALGVSGVTHYLADRRERGLMFWLIRHMDWAGKSAFMKLGVPRKLFVLGDTDAPNKEGERGRFEPNSIVPVDNPSLGTGAWALDQSWHIFFGVFVPALTLAGLS